MDTIKIALSGQVYNTSGLIYTFPNPLSTHPHQPWVLDLPEDARQEVRQVLRPGNVAKCLAIWSSQEGYFYSMLTPNGGGYMVVTVNTGDKVVSDGSLVLDMLEQLSDYFQNLPGAQTIDSAHVAGAANALHQALMSAPKPINNGAASLAYRTYVRDEHETELTDILQYACQAEYANFRRVYVVDQMMTNTQSNYQRIVTKIKKTYQVNCPEGVIASDLELVDGQKLTVTYRKEGYRDIQKSVLAGQEADFCVVEGCYIRVKAADELQLKFVRSFSFQVLGDNGLEVPSFRIGNKDFTSGKAIGIPSREVDLTISAEGYDDKLVHIVPAEMKNGDVIKVVLTSGMADFMLSVNTGKETLSAPIKIAGGSPLFHYLQGLNGRPIDVSGKAVAAPVEKPAEPKVVEVPRKENEYVPPTTPHFADHSNDVDKPAAGGSDGRRMFFIVVGVIVTVILLICGGIGYRLGWFGSSQPLQLVPPAGSDTTAVFTEEVVDATIPEEEEAAAPVAGKYTYLDGNEVWDMSKATTPEEKNFIALFHQREVSKMIESSMAAEIQNEKFKLVLAAIKSVPNDARRRVANIFENHSKDDIVDLNVMVAETQKLAGEFKPSTDQQQQAAAAAEKANVKTQE